MSRPTFDFKKMKESIFKKMKRKSRKGLNTMPGVYDELPPARPADDSTYLRPQKAPPNDLDLDTDVDNRDLPALPPAPPMPLTESVVTPSPLATLGTGSASQQALEHSRQSRNYSNQSNLLRDSRHIVTENHSGDAVEYAISRKEISPERHRLQPRNYKPEVDTTSGESEGESELYLRPSKSQQELLNLSAQSNDPDFDPLGSRYARHIDIAPSVDPYYTDASSVGKTRELKKLFESNPTPPRSHQTEAKSERFSKQNNTLKYDNRFYINGTSPNVAHRTGNVPSPWKQVVDPENTSDSNETVQVNPLIGMRQSDSGDRIHQDTNYYSVRNTNLNPNSNEETKIETRNNDNLYNLKDKYETTGQGYTDNNNISQSESSFDSPDNAAITEDVFTNNYSNPMRNNPYNNGADAKNTSRDDIEAPTMAYTRQTSADTQISPQPIKNIRSLYGNGRATIASRHSISPVKKSVSYDDSRSVVHDIYLTSSQPLTDELLDDAISVVTSHSAVSISRRTAAKKASVTSVESQTDIDPQTQTKFKTQGTSIGDTDRNDTVSIASSRDTSSRDTDRDLINYVTSADDIDFDDSVSRVDYKPNYNNKKQTRVRIETYREEYTQTEDVEPTIQVLPRTHHNYSRSKTYSHAMRERTALPGDWSNAGQGRSEFGSEVSKRLSKEWYKNEDAPELWDPDRMLTMFAEEVDRKASTTGPKSPICLRPEFDPRNFIDKVPKEDSSGVSFPAWKRKVMAKQMAERAQLEEDRLNARSEDEIRIDNMPVWKRALIYKNEKQRFGHH